MYATAAAKSLQSCPTLCDPIDGSPPCSSVTGILQARTLEWLPFPSPDICIHITNSLCCTPETNTTLWIHYIPINSVQSSHSIVFNSLQPYGIVRLPYPSPTPRTCSNLCPSSQWCHPMISSSVIPFFSCLQSFLASGSFPVESVLCTRWPKHWSFSFSIQWISRTDFL